MKKGYKSQIKSFWGGWVVLFSRDGKEGGAASDAGVDAGAGCRAWGAGGR